ncbi:MAG: hypothetical protein ACREQL_01960 [Candidatus Binatia bacterium]
MSVPDSDFATALSVLARAGAEFVVVGVGGINFYARDPSEAVFTLDLDVLLRPDVAVLRAALAALDRIGFSFAAGGEPFVDLDDDDALAALVRQVATLTARNTAGAQIDLMLAVTGARYEDLTRDAVEFRLGDAVVRVGRLARLLRVKEAAGRPKDREFLRAFKARSRKGRPRR